MVQKINSFFYRFFLPIITVLISAAIMGVSNMVLEFVELKVKVNAIQEDLNEVKNNDLPEIKREIEALHVFLIHSSAQEIDSKESGVSEKSLTIDSTTDKSLEIKVDNESKLSNLFLGPSPRLAWPVAPADPPFANFKNRNPGHYPNLRWGYGR